MKLHNKDKLLHKSFEIALFIKGVDGLLEIIGGILMIFLNPVRLNRFTLILTQHELSEDPRDVIANYMRKAASGFSISTQYFSIFYLMSHGIIKLVLVILLWKRKMWAYPLTIVSLILFIIYQVYRCMISYSTGLVMLTIFDILMIILTIIEYKRVT